MADLIVSAVVLICVGAAVRYIRKEKKRGVRCIGCPMAGNCQKKMEKGSCSEQE